MYFLSFFDWFPIVAPVSIILKIVNLCGFMILCLLSVFDWFPIVDLFFIILAVSCVQEKIETVCKFYVFSLLYDNIIFFVFNLFITIVERMVPSFIVHKSGMSTNP